MCVKGAAEDTQRRRRYRSVSSTVQCIFLVCWLSELRGYASPVLTATGFVNERWQFLVLINVVISWAESRPLQSCRYPPAAIVHVTLNARAMCLSVSSDSTLVTRTTHVGGHLLIAVAMTTANQWNARQHRYAATPWLKKTRTRTKCSNNFWLASPMLAFSC